MFGTRCLRVVRRLAAVEMDGGLFVKLVDHFVTSRSRIVRDKGVIGPRLKMVVVALVLSAASTASADGPIDVVRPLGSDHSVVSSKKIRDTERTQDRE
jgi:hypothetical protein